MFINYPFIYNKCLRIFAFYLILIINCTLGDPELPRSVDQLDFSEMDDFSIILYNRYFRDMNLK